MVDPDCSKGRIGRAIKLWGMRWSFLAQGERGDRVKRSGGWGGGGGEGLGPCPVGNQVKGWKHS